MKKFDLTIKIAVVLLVTTTSFSQIINFPDSNFKSLLLQTDYTNDIALDLNGNYTRIDVNNDSEIQLSEAVQISRLDFENASIFPLTVNNFVGIQNFINLEHLDCSSKQITLLNVSGMVNLKNLICFSNGLNNLNVNGCINLIFLDCSYNQLTSLNVIGCNDLETLNCNNNNLNSLNLSGLNNLQALRCYFNQMTSLDISSIESLHYIEANNNLISYLNIDSTPNIISLIIHTNNLNSLNINNRAFLQYLYIHDNYNLVSLNAMGCSSLKTLHCAQTSIGLLDMSDCYNLSHLYCNNAQLYYLNIKNQHTESQLNLDNNPNISYICCDNNEIAFIQNFINSPTCQISSDCSLTNEKVINKLVASSFPNPSNDRITFNQDIKSIIIYSIDGKLIDYNLLNNQIDLSGFNPGIYLVRGTTIDGVSFSEKLVKN